MHIFLSLEPKAENIKKKEKRKRRKRFFSFGKAKLNQNSFRENIVLLFDPHHELAKGLHEVFVTHPPMTFGNISNQLFGH